MFHALWTMLGLTLFVRKIRLLHHNPAWVQQSQKQPFAILKLRPHQVKDMFPAPIFL